MRKERPPIAMAVVEDEAAREAVLQADLQVEADMEEINGCLVEGTRLLYKRSSKRFPRKGGANTSTPTKRNHRLAIKVKVLMCRV